MAKAVHLEDREMERMHNAVVHGYVCPFVEGEEMVRVLMFDDCRNGLHKQGDSGCCGVSRIVEGYVWECGCWCHLAPAHVPA